MIAITKIEKNLEALTGQRKSHLGTMYFTLHISLGVNSLRDISRIYQVMKDSLEVSDNNLSQNFSTRLFL